MPEKGQQNRDILLLSGILGMATAGSAAMVLARWALTGRLTHAFLIQNLLLAWVPYLVSLVTLPLSRLEPARKRRLWVGIAALVWLVFYPNSPYIFTDFIHVIRKSYLGSIPLDWLTPMSLLWYDVILNTTFAFIGHFIGLISMNIIHSSLKRSWGRAASWAFLTAAIILSGFGIYLGRFVRLNSWDILIHPLESIRRIATEGYKPRVILFSASFSLFIATTYLILRIFSRVKLFEPGEPRGGDSGDGGPEPPPRR